MSEIVPPQPDDVVAWITIRHHAGGTVSVGGTIGDARYAKRLLDHARDAITRQVPEHGLVIPNSDVDLSANPGLREMGDIPISQRGDP